MKRREEEKLVRRLRLIEGQVRGVIRLLTEDRSPVEILTQISSIQEALRSVCRFVMKDYLGSTAYQVVRSKNAEMRNRLVEDFLSTLLKFTR